MEDEGGMRGALGGGRVRVAEFGRPGQIQKVKVEGGAGAGLLGSWPGGLLGRRSRSRAGVAGEKRQENQGESEGTRLHGGRIRNLLEAFNRAAFSSKGTERIQRPCGGWEPGSNFRIATTQPVLRT